MIRAFAQLDDPAFIGVVLRSLAWSVVCFATLFIAIDWGAGRFLPAYGAWAWVAHLLSGLGTALLAFWLFVPAAVGIGAMFIERVARAVERQFYPLLPPCVGAPLSVQMWDGIVVALRVLMMTALSLVLALLLPGIGALLGWAISGWAIGRGFFVAVAMRRMSRPAAQALARRYRGPVLLQGGILALAGFLPPLNLLIPVLGVAAMVHLLHLLQSAADVQSVPLDGAGTGHAIAPRQNWL
jgi:uncharacterized protein involved in cysteine biosynthesis